MTTGGDGATLSRNAIKDVVAGEAACEKRHPGVSFERVAATNQYFNKPAAVQPHPDWRAVLERPLTPRGGALSRAKRGRGWSRCDKRRIAASVTVRFSGSSSLLVSSEIEPGLAPCSSLDL